MEASERTISQVLTEQIRYEIPPYQRPYSWDRSNVEQLLDDLWDAYMAREEEYFIGSLITIEKEKGALYEVVDGQQRLTTLNLIFARLRDKVDEPARSTLGKRVLPRNELTGEEETPRLTLRKKDQQFFHRHVLASEPVTPDMLASLARDQDAPKLRIAENVVVIDEFCDGKDQQVLKLFANYLLTKVYAVLVTTSSWQSAYRLFNVLNARGMPLSNADIIKNLLFSRLGGSSTKSQDLDERWLELEESIGIERMDQFLGHHRYAVTPSASRRTLHEEFEPLITASPDPFQFLDTLNQSARNYVHILNNDFSTPRAKRALKSLHRVKFEEWIAPLLAFMNTTVQGMEIDTFAELLERITYQNWIRRLGRSARLTVYFQLINAIRAGRPAEEIQGIFRAHARNEEFRTLLDGDVYGLPFARAVMLRLEEASQDDSVTKEYGGQITIEHVLPQTRSVDYWKENFTADQHRKWVHRLGNLALLAGIKNYAAQNHSFDQKKRAYEQRNSRVSFDTTKGILEKPDWTVEEIVQRHEHLLSEAQRLWCIN